MRTIWADQNFIGIFYQARLPPRHVFLLPIFDDRGVNKRRIELTTNRDAQTHETGTTVIITGSVGRFVGRPNTTRLSRKERMSFVSRIGRSVQIQALEYHFSSAIVARCSCIG